MGRSQSIRSLTWALIERAIVDKRSAAALSEYILPALNSRGRRELLAERVRDGVSGAKSVVGRSRAIAELLVFVRGIVASVENEVPPAPVVFAVVLDFLRPSYMHLGENFIDSVLGRKQTKASPAEREFLAYIPYLMGIAVSSACGVSRDDLVTRYGVDLSAVSECVANAYRPKPAYDDLDALILLTAGKTDLPFRWLKAAMPVMREYLSGVRYLWSALKRCRKRRAVSVMDLIEDALAEEIREESRRMVRNLVRVVKQAGDDHETLLSVLKADQLADVMLNRSGRGNDVVQDFLADKAAKLKAVVEARAADRLKRKRMEQGAALADRCIQARRAEPWQLARIKEYDPCLYGLLEATLTALLPNQAKSRPTRAYGRPRASEPAPMLSAQDEADILSRIGLDGTDLLAGEPDSPVHRLGHS